MCHFIETIHVENGRILRASLHNQRMNTTRHFFFGPDIPDYNLEEILQETSLYQQRTRCRVIYGKEIEEISFLPYCPRPVQSLRIINHDTLDYSFKYADRSEINQLYEQRNEQDDILIVKQGRITDTSIGNIALFDGYQWVTPKYPLLKGTHRADLIAQGIIVEKDLLLTDLQSYQQVCIFNAMLEFEEIKLDVTSIK